MTHHHGDSLHSSSLRVTAPFEPSHGPFPDDLPTPPPAEWMPLDEIAETWGTFGAHTRDAQGWLATSDAFAALAMETEAYQRTAALLARPSRSRGYPATRLDVHAGPPPLVRRASRHQPHPKRPAPDDGTVYEMPPQGGWRSETERSGPTRSRSRRRVHPLLTLGLGMLVMLALWQAGIGITSWWQVHQDDVTYGRPRTYQTDAVVGHFDSAAHPSHFLAENLHRRVVIFELQGGDASKTRVYVGPLLSGPGADLAPMTLAFPVIGGKVAMVVNVQAIHLVYLNKPVKGVWQFVPQQG